MRLRTNISLKSCKLEGADYWKQLVLVDMRICCLRSNISWKNCEYAVAEVLPSSCKVAILYITKICACPPLISIFPPYPWNHRKLGQGGAWPGSLMWVSTHLEIFNVDDKLPFFQNYPNIPLARLRAAARGWSCSAGRMKYIITKKLS